jgi:alpha-L-fucosidase
MTPTAYRIAVSLLSLVGPLCAAPSAAAQGIPETAVPSVIVNTQAEPIAPGKFQPTWDSLKQYQLPKWFRDAKFGIWAHWGPQCQPEDGDWYARGMYQQGSGQYKSHLAQYGHPSVSGFKDVINTWKAEKWDPEKLVKLYKRVGAQYFFALANHHDNFDLWDSKYQPWNAVKVGPKRDLIAGWAQAARDNGLPFGVSVHASHAWSWYEVAQGADKTGDLAGIPYDGKRTRADGAGLWWDGLDPQDLYAQNHSPSPDFQNPGKIHSRWNWSNGVTLPDQAYCDKFYNRTADLIKRYHPDLIYFDDTALPLWPVSDAGLKIAADFYNTNMAQSGGKSEGVLFGKILDSEQRKAIVWDIERGVPATGFPFAWQTDTCIGDWHYSRSLYNRNGYKSAKTVVQMLADIVSKNGNLLLNIPLRGDGSPDEKELKVLQDIAAWMDVNKEAIFSTRPWVVFGEGPASGAPISAQGFNEGKGKPFTAQDVRFTVKGGVLYAILMDWPADQNVNIKALAVPGATARSAPEQRLTDVSLLGSPDKLEWTQEPDGLKVKLPPKAPCDGPVVLKIDLASPP